MKELDAALAGAGCPPVSPQHGLPRDLEQLEQVDEGEHTLKRPENQCVQWMFEFKFKM